MLDAFSTHWKNPLPRSWKPNHAIAAAIFFGLLSSSAPAQFRVQPQPAPPPQSSPARHAAIPTDPHDWPQAQTPEVIALRSCSSPAERKLSFNLLLLARSVRKAPLGNFASLLDTSEVNPDGTVTVEINASLSPSLMASPVMATVVRVNGAIPLDAYISDRLRARVDKRQLLDLASNPNVLAIRDVGSSLPSSVDSIPRAPSTL